MLRRHVPSDVERAEGPGDKRRQRHAHGRHHHGRDRAREEELSLDHFGDEEGGEARRHQHGREAQDLEQVGEDRPQREPRAAARPGDQAIGPEEEEEVVEAVAEPVDGKEDEEASRV